MDMILFQKDWARFPSAVADTKTTNESFLRLAYFYKEKLKVANWKFILTLLQPDLQGVDPFDEMLDDVTKTKIQLECKYNPWYYFREVARIPPTSGNVPVQFRANRANIALYWSFFNGVDFGLLQPRQTGKSVSTDILMNGITYIWGENTSINLVTKDNKLRNANMERLKEMRDLLPDYIHSNNANDADNMEMLTCIRLGNRYLTAVARNDKIAADKLGRGLTVPIQHFDEFAYCSLIEISLPVALSAGSAARDDARANGHFFGNVYTTTAGNITTRDGAFAHQFMTGGAVWDERYLDLAGAPTFRLVVEKGSSGKKALIYGAFNHRQLGRTDGWLYRTLKESGSFGEIADRDFFNIWTVGGEGSPLTPSTKTRIKDSEMEPLHIEITNDGYTLRWYIPKEDIDRVMANGRYVMGLDSSELFGEGNDATAMIITDIETHEVICVGKYNETSIPVLANFLGMLLLRFKTVLFVPERKSTGSSIIDIVILLLHKAGQDPFKRIFNRIVNESTTLESEYREIQMGMSLRTPNFYDRFKRYFGFATAGTGLYSRTGLYHDGLVSAMEYGARVIKDKMLSLELLALTIKNGKIDHSKGNHDDLVIALLLGHWVCVKGQNLQYYGIDPSKVFSRAIVRDHQLTPMELHAEEGNKRNRTEFDRLIEELKCETNQLVVAKIEMRLRNLAKTVNTEELQGAGIDAMLRQVKEDRTRSVRLSKFRG